MIGFCLNYFQLKKIKNSEIYQIEINSKQKKGKMHYGESNIKGRKKDTIVFSSYICHPSMINNELISPLLLTELFNYLSSLDNLYYSYKLWLSPETIGSIAIIHKNFSFLKKNVKAGFVVTCMGGVGEHSYISSKYENTYADKLLNFAISEFKNPKIHKYTDRGSDERQFGSPNINLPFVTITKTKFGDYPEYHTSGDNYKFLSKNAVVKSFNFLKRLIFIIESNQKYISNVYCEPHLEKYDLFDNYNNVRDILNVWTYCDGKNDIIDIVNKVGLNYDKVVSIVKVLLSKKIIKEL